MDDYYEDWPGVIEAVDELIAFGELKVVTRVNQSVHLRQP